ncbi:S-layer domain protein [Sediminispirochaeta smaragdinae DSM 11293]|uniref:S-layer domain protein n=2 Tax=Sediminispirochaeta TaxID=1911556 RepID=E1R1D4_SEDSS|nr:S-layer domain protein [Sediminispirochaeta smaragdinae DSM 11293]
MLIPIKKKRLVKLSLETGLMFFTLIALIVSCSHTERSRPVTMEGGPGGGPQGGPGGPPPQGVPHETVMVAQTLPEQVSSQYFSDLDARTASINAYVDYLYEKGILVGYATSYYPDQVLTRADLAVMLDAKFKYDGTAPGYTDVGKDTYYYQATMQGKAVGAFEDVDRFYPDKAVTREQAAVWIYLSERLNGMPKELVTKNVSKFGDSDDISKNAREAVATVVKLGILKADDAGNFNPNGIFTRAEIAPIMYRILCLGGSPRQDGPGPGRQGGPRDSGEPGQGPIPR